MKTWFCYHDPTRHDFVKISKMLGPVEAEHQVLQKRAESRALDKFYTRRDVASWCVQTAMDVIGALAGNVLYVESSAGDGAFLDALPLPRIGMDIVPAPERPDIVQCDFLQWIPRKSTGSVIVIGNPPFGKNASLALKFLNHAGRFADYVAFILPRTFEKDSTKRKILCGLELAYETPLPPDSFLYDGQAYSVPVVFQIWHRTGALFIHPERTTTHPDFEFVKDPMDADFAFQRVGAAAGKVSKEGLKKSPQSHYFIRRKSQQVDIMLILSRIDWSHIKYKTAGNPSIGKQELIAEYRKAIQ